MAESKLYVAGFDLHYPAHNKATWRAMLEFILSNSIHGFIFGGDQFDNQCISPHTRGKPLYRDRGAYVREERGFVKNILSPLEAALGPIEKVWIVGNHDDWERQAVEEQPELEGLIDRPSSLNLKGRGWEVIPIGYTKRIGKLHIIHGEFLTGIGNQGGLYPAKKAVDLMAANVLAGHTHSPQSFTRIAPVERTQKWQGWIAPALCNKNPNYLRNRPTAWLNGFVIIELMPKGLFNLYPVIVSRGKASYGGKIYG